MKKFILISFGFLGWAFYEMSGGEEFEPASARLAAQNPAPDTAETPVVAAPATVTVAQTEPDFVDTDPPLEPEVTRVSLNLTSLDAVLSGDEDAAEAVDTAAVTAETDAGAVPRNVAVITDSADTPAIIPSLITGSAPVASVDASLNTTETAETITGLQDIRSVTGNRVNVRGGPSTDFSIVQQVVRGDEVEVLEDNGDGWVRMRTLDGTKQGWMADFLLSSG